MRILHLIKGLGRGGAERLLVAGLDHADRTRFEYQYAYCLPRKDALVEELRARGAKVTCFAARRPTSAIGVSSKVARYCRAQGVHLIHSHLPWTGTIGRLAGIRAHVPVVYSEHNKQERYHPLTRFAGWCTWRWQREVIAVSESVKDSIERSLGTKVPVRVVQNGIDGRVFQRTSAQGEGIRAKLGIQAGSPVVGTVAVFRAQKRLDRWVKAAALIRASQPSARFLMVGDGPLMPGIREAARAASLGDAVYFAGLQEDVRPWLSAMDVFMMTSEVEGLPVALLEAMAMECVPAAFAVGGIPEVVTDSRNGILEKPGGIDALARRVSDLLANPAAVRGMGWAGRAAVVGQFGIGRMTRQIEALYASILWG